ncbi:MAG: acylphosphatase [Chloroflexi bacterium]|nr:acylphosphatase [Chloroflexota bacterium]MDA1297662.1 acylphosphatase [Chloroflexota bacterium]
MKPGAGPCAGCVQGVGFRMYVHREASLLGLRGHVRNTADGSVEVVAGGLPEVLDQLHEKLRKGPQGSTVSDVLAEPYDGDAEALHAPFTITR